MYNANTYDLHGHHQTHIGGSRALGANIHTSLVTIEPVVKQLSRRLCRCSKGGTADLRTDSISTTEIGTVTVEAAIQKFGEHGGSLMVKERRRGRRRRRGVQRHFYNIV
jgi:hypothetical protein